MMNTMTTTKNPALEALIAEQGYCKLHYFRALVHSSNGYRNVEFFAKSLAFARRMAVALVDPADTVLSVRAL